MRSRLERSPPVMHAVRKRAKRSHAWMTRPEWALYKQLACIVTEHDRRKARGRYWPAPADLGPPIRSRDEIEADAARMLCAQMDAQRKRWGYA